MAGHDLQAYQNTHVIVRDGWVITTYRDEKSVRRYIKDAARHLRRSRRRKNRSRNKFLNNHKFAHGWS